MNREIEKKNNRVRFVNVAINDPKKAATKLRQMANGLSNCENTSDVIYALSEIFAVSERTILRDIKKN
jgi:hypothetical protein